MDTLLQNVAVRDDGTIDLNELTRRLTEKFVNDPTDIQVEELHGGVAPRNGYRGRALDTVAGPIAPRVPKPRGGTCFPGDVIGPHSRTDRAPIGAVAEMHVDGVSTGKVGKAAAETGSERPGPSQASRMRAALDGEAAGLRPMRFGGMRFPCVFCQVELSKRDCGGNLGPNPSYATRPKSLRYCMGLL